MRRVLLRALFPCPTPCRTPRPPARKSHAHLIHALNLSHHVPRPIAHISTSRTLLKVVAFASRRLLPAHHHRWPGQDILACLANRSREFDLYFRSDPYLSRPVLLATAHELRHHWSGGGQHDCTAGASGEAHLSVTLWSPPELPARQFQGARPILLSVGLQNLQERHQSKAALLFVSLLLFFHLLLFLHLLSPFVNQPM